MGLPDDVVGLLLIPLLETVMKQPDQPPINQGLLVEVLISVLVRLVRVVEPRGDRDLQERSAY